MMRTLVLASVTLTVLFASPAAGADRRPQAGSTEIVTFAKTVELDPITFGSPWQLAWIPTGTKTGAIAFTDRGKNQVGLLDPATFRTQNIRLNAVTSPGPIVVIDSTRFAVAGTGGVAIFDRAGTGKLTELAMSNTRNQALALSNGDLVVADALQHDLRIIRPPYSGPADITRFPLPPQCRNPTGLVPGASQITVLCQQTNNIVRIDYSGNFGSATTLPVANAGAQEARPSPNGIVFSGFNANQVFSYSASYADGFKSYALTGPAVPAVGYFDDPTFDKRLQQAAAHLRAGKKPERRLFFNSFTPSFRGSGVSLGSFPGAKARAIAQLSNRNLVGSTNGPDGTIWVADATPGKPALHRINFGDVSTTVRTKTGYRFSQRLTQVSPDFLARMSMPFSGPVPTEVRLGVTGASASPYRLKQSFGENFGLNVAARAALRRGGTYQVKVQSADTGAYTRAYRISNIQPGTKNLTFTFTGGGAIPASFKVDAVADTPPCECDSLDVELRPTSYGNDGGAVLAFVWELACTGGNGACQGTLGIAADKTARKQGVRLGLANDSARIKVEPTSDEINVSCKSDCSRPTTRDSGGYVSVRTPQGSVLGKDVGSVSVVVERTCKRALAPKIFRIAFGAGGVVSERRSDLNGNGVADGKEKK